MQQVRQGQSPPGGDAATAGPMGTPSGSRDLNLCNLYSITTNQAAISALFRVVNRYFGNLAPMPGVFPDYRAPIVRGGPDGRELALARWGMPSSSKALMDATKKRAEMLQVKDKSVDFKALLRMEPDSGTTNIPNVKQTLDAMAGSGAPLRGALQQLQRIQQGRGRRHLVRARRDPPAALLRRHLGPSGRRSGRSRKARRPTISTRS